MPLRKPFSLVVDADEKLRKCVPKQWLEFFGESNSQCTELVFHLRTENELNELRLPDGWNLSAPNGIQQAVYVSHSIACFSLAYEAPDNELTVYVRRPMDTYVRSGILYGMLIALHKNYVGLHGATVACGNQIVILSGPSGIGKTTLAQLLLKHCDARVINGDFALLSFDNDRVMFEPTPFCGTSRICLDERVKVDRVVFLEQSKENVWKDLDGRQSLVSVLNNTFIPTFDGQLRQAVQNSIVHMLPYVKTSVYAFAPTVEAAKLFSKHIEC